MGDKERYYGPSDKTICVFSQNSVEGLVGPSSIVDEGKGAVHCGELWQRRIGARSIERNTKTVGWGFSQRRSREMSYPFVRGHREEAPSNQGPQGKNDVPAL